MDAFLTNAAAAVRNYSVTPRLGNIFWLASSLFCRLFMSFLPEYKTVQAVAGPLVVLQNVKVSQKMISFWFV